MVQIFITYGVSTLLQEDKEQYLSALLISADLHDHFKDISFFNNHIEELKTKGFVTRKFFQSKSIKFFDNNVGKSENFEKMGRGKYRLKH
ncbi:hypothetical protein [Methanolobus bombayensis]|uniref:hypothetical protein n=1 Tax=Methanolobus bombayensis TaxID=38023 RepID=UPI001AE6C3B7|nr:hypothetical protein [Methanolobus bombayensis]MBP1908273.1 hypothetical protein [Methanolobus bombayensis]